MAEKTVTLVNHHKINETPAKRSIGEFDYTTSGFPPSTAF